MFAFDAHGDRAGFFVGGEFQFVPVHQRDLASLGEGVVFGIAHAAGVAHHAHMGGYGKGFGQFHELGHGLPVGVEFEPLGVGHQPLDADALGAWRHEDDVAIGELYQWHGAVEQKVVEVDGGAHLGAAFDLHGEKAAAFQVDAASLIEIVEQAVHAGAVVQAGPHDVAADVDAHGLGGGEAGVAEDVGAEHAAHGGFDLLLQVFVGDAEHLHGADLGQEDIALGIHGEHVVVGKSAPQAQMDAVADGDKVIGIELGGARAGKIAGK